MARIVLGIGGGIAAYKAAILLRLLTEAGHNVRVVPTEAALNFVGRATWEALSGNPVSTTVFEKVDEVEHVRIGHEAELVVVAPATADLLARVRAGRADDLLTATLLTTTAPVVLAPAMHTEMWHNAATVENVATLRGRGITVIEPDSGRLTGKDSGPGRLPEPEAIFDRAMAALRSSADGPLSGRTVLISAGGTREPIDPVRFIGNRSSGRQGVALARAAAAAGAAVQLVGANLAVPVPPGIDFVPVESTAELRSAMHLRAPGADIVIMCAAVSDFRPATVIDTKIKKTGGSGMTLEMVQNPDILAELVSGRTDDQLIVGFAAETGDDDGSVLDYGGAKLLRKGCDLLVVNEVGANRAFGTEDNTVTVLAVVDGEPTAIGRADGSKDDVSQCVISLIGDRAAR